MDAVCIVVAKDAAIVNSGQMGHEEGKIVSNDLFLFIDLDLFAENTDASGTPKVSFIIGVLEKAALSAHNRILVQVTLRMQHLRRIFPAAGSDCPQ
jgi:hypothetical protein